MMICREPERSPWLLSTRALRICNADLRDQRVVIFGSGTAGIGNADQIRAAMMLAGLSKEEATRHFWCVDIQGLAA